MLGPATPLLMLLAVDFVIAIAWWAVTYFGVSLDERMVKIMIVLIVLINLVVVIFWALGLLGWIGPYYWPEPYRRRP